ncbi:hypothetical protein ACOMHN_011859 [Nucella lapillus]
MRMAQLFVSVQRKAGADDIRSVKNEPDALKGNNSFSLILSLQYCRESGFLLKPCSPRQQPVTEQSRRQTLPPSAQPQPPMAVAKKCRLRQIFSGNDGPTPLRQPALRHLSHLS